MKQWDKKKKINTIWHSESVNFKIVPFHRYLLTQLERGRFYMKTQKKKPSEGNIYRFTIGPCDLWKKKKNANHIVIEPIKLIKNVR